MTEERQEQPGPFAVCCIGIRVVVDNTVPAVKFLDRDMPGAPDFTADDSPQSRHLREVVDKHPGHHWPASRVSSAIDVYAVDLVTPPAEDPYQPVVQEFATCGLPEGHPEYETYVVIAYNRGGGWWSVRRGGRLVTVDGQESLRCREDNPEDNPELFMDVDTALRLAVQHAQTFRRRGRTAADVLAAEQATATA